MTVRTVVQTLSGATLAITATIPETYDTAGYESTDLVFTSIGEVEDHGSHGVQATIVEFTPVDTAVVAKMKGSKNYGQMDCVLGSVPGNSGQALLKTASESNNHYSIKITYPTGTGESTPEIHYLDVIVGSFEYQDGTVDDVQRINVSLALTRAPVVIAAT